jgi:hypothetical protein
MWRAVAETWAAAVVVVVAVGLAERKDRHAPEDSNARAVAAPVGEVVVETDGVLSFPEHAICLVIRSRPGQEGVRAIENVRYTLTPRAGGSRPRSGRPYWRGTRPGRSWRPGLGTYSPTHRSRAYGGRGWRSANTNWSSNSGAVIGRWRPARRLDCGWKRRNIRIKSRSLSRRRTRRVHGTRAAGTVMQSGGSPGGPCR